MWSVDQLPVMTFCIAAHYGPHHNGESHPEANRAKVPEIARIMLVAYIACKKDAQLGRKVQEKRHKTDVVSLEGLPQDRLMSWWGLLVSAGNWEKHSTM